MKRTRIAVGVLVVAALAYEIYALINPNVATISDFFWAVGVDRGMAGAPVAGMLGFLLGHLLWPRRVAVLMWSDWGFPVWQPRMTLWGVGIAAWFVYEFVALFWLPDWPWTTSRLAYGWISQIGVPYVDVLLVHVIAGHFLFPRFERRQA